MCYICVIYNCYIGKGYVLKFVQCSYRILHSVHGSYFMRLKSTNNLEGDQTCLKKYMDLDHALAVIVKTNCHFHPTTLY